MCVLTSIIIFLGVVSSNGQPWIHDRRFVFRNLRDLGMGKSYMADAIQVEAQALVDEIKSLGEVPMIPPKGLRTAVLNVVWQMVAGKRYDLRSTEVDSIFNLFEDFRKGSSLIFFDFFFPVFKILPESVRGKILGSHVMTTFRKEMHAKIYVNMKRDYFTIIF